MISSSASRIYSTQLNTPLGAMVACADDSGICLLEFSDRNELEKEYCDIEALFNSKNIEGSNKHLDELSIQLAEYFERKRTAFDLSVHLKGTPFQVRVWSALLEIPYGETRTYKQQSIFLGDLKAIRAVASANGTNRIAILIPCHRVVGDNGKLTGYSGGLWRKEKLLTLESPNQLLLF